MKYIVIIFLILFPLNSVAQDSLLYKHRIDSVLVYYSHRPMKRMKIKRNEKVIYYCYNRKSHKLIAVNIYEKKLDADKNSWVYKYNFINGELVMISKYNGRGIGDKRRAVAFYYFKDDKLVYLVENSTQIDNIELEKAKGLEFVNSTLNY